MGIIENFKNLFVEKRKMRILSEAFQMFNGYSPSFTSFSGGIYEMDLTRASVHALATHTSKLNPVIKGKAYRSLEKVLQMQPNDFMTTQQFLYRLRTIYEVENNAYIIPIYGDKDQIVGLYPISTMGSQLVRIEGKIYLRYTLNGITSAIEYERVGHLKKHHYLNEFFGSNHNALYPTMELINTQNQGIVEGIKQSASIRFIGKLINTLIPEDVEKERARFIENNLSSNNNGGILLYDNKYAEVKAIDSTPWTIDDKQSELVKKNVFNYFGVNEPILQNSFDENQWDSFYEGAIESFAIQLSQVVTCMLFTQGEIKNSNIVMFESSRLQYASNTTKLNIVEKLFDRGFMSHNQGLAIFNLPSIPNGDKLYIRKEYAEVSKLDKEVEDGEQEKENGEQIEKITVKETDNT
jgi:hypothetical protein